MQKLHLRLHHQFQLYYIIIWIFTKEKKRKMEVMLRGTGSVDLYIHDNWVRIPMLCIASLNTIQATVFLDNVGGGGRTIVGRLVLPKAQRYPGSWHWRNERSKWDASTCASLERGVHYQNKLAYLYFRHPDSETSGCGEECKFKSELAHIICIPSSLT